MTFSIFLDGIFILIFALNVINGVRRGLLKSFLGILGTVIAFFLAGFMADFFANVSYTLVFEDVLKTTISDFLTNNASFDINTFSFSGKFAPFLNFIKTCIESNIGHEMVGQNTITRLFSKYILKILKSSFIILFYAAIKSVISAIFKVFKQQKIFAVDTLFGGIFGALKGAISVTIFILLLNIISPMLSGKYEFFTKEELNSSIIFNQINKNVVQNYLQFVPFL